MVFVPVSMNELLDYVYTYRFHNIFVSSIFDLFGVF